MTDMTQDEAREIKNDLTRILARMDVLDAKVAALPDKAAIYTASFAIHALIWATVLGTIVVLNALGAFS
jgi:hypothetical protein